MIVRLGAAQLCRVCCWWNGIRTMEMSILLCTFLFQPSESTLSLRLRLQGTGAHDSTKPRAYRNSKNFHQPHTQELSWPTPYSCISNPPITSMSPARGSALLSTLPQHLFCTSLYPIWLAGPRSLADLHGVKAADIPMPVHGGCVIPYGRGDSKDCEL